MKISCQEELPPGLFCCSPFSIGSGDDFRRRIRLRILYISRQGSVPGERRGFFMKLFHLSDLHIGKYLNGYSLKDTQEALFRQIAAYTAQEKPDVILLCGDIYDKSVPAAEAFTAFDRLLRDLSGASETTEILVISGNHDSAERLSYASLFLKEHRIHIGALPPRTKEDRLLKITREDSFGPVNFYLFPFIRPGMVRHLFEEGRVTDYDSAFRAVLSCESLNEKERNVILAHQFFVSGEKQPEICDSEASLYTVGGLDQIDASALDGFDYAALGHLHGPQKVGQEHIRYCGSPGKYSVSEEYHRKAISMVTLGQKGSPVQIEQLPLVMEPEIRRLRGTLQEMKELSESYREDYVSITLTDEEEVIDFREQLEERFSKILEIRIDNRRTRGRLNEELGEMEHLDPLTAFHRFYEAVRRAPMTKEQEALMREVIEEAGGEEHR